MTVNREEAYKMCMGELMKSQKWDSVDFSQKLQIIKSLSEIYQKIPEEKLNMFNSELILSEIAERGDRTKSINRLSKKLVDFNRQLYREVIFSDKEKIRELLFRDDIES